MFRLTHGLRANQIRTDCADDIYQLKGAYSRATQCSTNLQAKSSFLILPNENPHRNKFRVLSKFSLSPFSRRGRLSRGCCTVHCRCAVVVTMFELSKSISVSRLALESGPSNSFPSPLSVSLDIVVSFGSWFATPLGVDLVSAPCSAWPGGNRRGGGVGEPRHRARRGGVGGWDYL